MASRLHHSSDNQPGFTRRQVDGGFVYLNVRGRVISAPKVIARCEQIGIPPAYTHVWICPDIRGHLQATARDDKGRRQYFYHPAWTAHRDTTKFQHLLTFAGAIGKVRHRVARDLGLRGVPKLKIVAAIVRLLDTTYVRIGNEEYARENKSYGLTTLLHRHLRGRGAHMRFVFKGKSGVTHEVALHDKRLRKIVAECQDLPGQDLFEYLDEGGRAWGVHSDDVNAYLQELTAREITAKDFRTWHGTVIAAGELLKQALPVELSERKRAVVLAVKTTADALGNTVAVCRKCYIHPKLIEVYLAGELHEPRSVRQLQRKYRGLYVDELKVVSFLEKW